MGCNKSSCSCNTGCSSVLEKIKHTLKCFFDLLSERFIDGVQPFRALNLDQIGEVVNSRATMVEDYEIFNSHTVLQYVKLYNLKRLALTTDTPVMTLLIPAESGENITLLKRLFDIGLSIRATALKPDNDATPPAADSIVVNIGYRTL